MLPSFIFQIELHTKLQNQAATLCAVTEHSGTHFQIETDKVVIGTWGGWSRSESELLLRHLFEANQNPLFTHQVGSASRSGDLWHTGKYYHLNFKQIVLAAVPCPRWNSMLRALHGTGNKATAWVALRLTQSPYSSVGLETGQPGSKSLFCP